MTTVVACQSGRARASGAGDVRVSDFTLMVRVPGKPAAIRVFTDDEADGAAKYAADRGAVGVPLPLSPPDGYVVGPDGKLVPAAEPTEPDSV